MIPDAHFLYYYLTGFVQFFVMQIKIFSPKRWKQYTVIKDRFRDLGVDSINYLKEITKKIIDLKFYVLFIFFFSNN